MSVGENPGYHSSELAVWWSGVHGAMASALNTAREGLGSARDGMVNTASLIKRYFGDCYEYTKNIFGEYGLPVGHFKEPHFFGMDTGHHRNEYWYLPYLLLAFPLYVPFNILVNILGNTGINFASGVSRSARFLFDGRSKQPEPTNWVRKMVWGAPALPLVVAVTLPLTIAAIAYHTVKMTGYFLNKGSDRILNDQKTKESADSESPSAVSHVLGGPLGLVIAAPLLMGLTLGYGVLKNLAALSATFKTIYNAILQNATFDLKGQSLKDLQWFTAPGLIMGALLGLGCALVSATVQQSAHSLSDTSLRLARLAFGSSGEAPEARPWSQQALGLPGFLLALALVAPVLTIAALIKENALSFADALSTLWTGIVDQEFSKLSERTKTRRFGVGLPGLVLGGAASLIVSPVCAMIKESCIGFADMTAYISSLAFNYHHETPERGPIKRGFGLPGIVLAAAVMGPLLGGFALIWENLRSLSEAFTVVGRRVLEIRPSVQEEVAYKTERSQYRKIAGSPGLMIGAALGLSLGLVAGIFTEFGPSLDDTVKRIYGIAFDHDLTVAPRSYRKHILGLPGSLLAAAVAGPLFSVIALIRENVLSLIQSFSGVWNKVLEQQTWERDQTTDQTGKKERSIYRQFAGFPGLVIGASLGLVMSSIVGLIREFCASFRDTTKRISSMAFGYESSIAARSNIKHFLGAPGLALAAVTMGPVLLSAALIFENLCSFVESFKFLWNGVVEQQSTELSASRTAVRRFGVGLPGLVLGGAASLALSPVWALIKESCIGFAHITAYISSLAFNHSNETPVRGFVKRGFGLPGIVLATAVMGPVLCGLALIWENMRSFADAYTKVQNEILELETAVKSEAESDQKRSIARKIAGLPAFLMGAALSMMISSIAGIFREFIPSFRDTTKRITNMIFGHHDEIGPRSYAKHIMGAPGFLLATAIVTPMLTVAKIILENMLSFYDAFATLWTGIVNQQSADLNTGRTAAQRFGLGLPGLVLGGALSLALAPVWALIKESAISFIHLAARVSAWAFGYQNELAPRSAIKHTFGSPGFMASVATTAPLLLASALIWENLRASVRGFLKSCELLSGHHAESASKSSDEQSAEFAAKKLSKARILISSLGYAIGFLGAIVTVGPFYVLWQTLKTAAHSFTRAMNWAYGKPQEALEESRYGILGHAASLIVYPVALLCASLSSAWYGARGSRIADELTAARWNPINNRAAQVGGVLMSQLLIPVPLIGAALGYLGLKHFASGAFWTKNVGPAVKATMIGLAILAFYVPLTIGAMLYEIRRAIQYWKNPRVRAFESNSASAPSKDTQDFLDQVNGKFKDLFKSLSVSGKLKVLTEDEKGVDQSKVAARNADQTQYGKWFGFCRRANNIAVSVRRAFSLSQDTVTENVLKKLYADFREFVKNFSHNHEGAVITIQDIQAFFTDAVGQEAISPGTRHHLMAWRAKSSHDRKKLAEIDQVAGALSRYLGEKPPAYGEAPGYGATPFAEASATDLPVYSAPSSPKFATVVLDATVAANDGLVWGNMGFRSESTA